MKIHAALWSAFLLCGVAAAQTATTDARTRKAVDELVAVSDMTGMLERSLKAIAPVLKTQITDMLMPTVQKEMPGVPIEEGRAAVANFVDGIVDRTLGPVETQMKKEVLEAMYQLYPKYLSTDDLEYIANVYREDKVLRKAMRTMPDIMRDLTERLLVIQQSIAQNMQAAVETDMPNLMENLEKLAAKHQRKVSPVKPKQ